MAALGLIMIKGENEPDDGKREPKPDEARTPSAPVLRLIPWGVVGIASLLVAAFAELSDELGDAQEAAMPAFAADATILRFVAQFRRPWLDGLAIDLTALGSPIVVALFTLALGAVLLLKSDRRGAAILVLTSLVSAAAVVVSKTLFDRPRPSVVPRLVEVTGLSYPSGHSLGSAAVFLTAAIIMARHFPVRTGRLGSLAVTAVLVSLIGASRVYLGVHYPSDVLGGVLLGTAWTVFMSILLRWLDRRATVRRNART
ncbi:phosphatase PAP2 family protein [soil metagenome]